MNTILSIAFGGALGAVLRHFANLAALKSFGDDFPYGTLSVNILGSLLMGALISFMAHSWQPPEEVKLFLVTGMLGAFTTFSTFSLDFSVLYTRGDLMGAGLYVLISVTGAILALFLGMMVVRHLVS